MFKLLILDSDGVLSSQKIVDENGKTVYKQFEDKNWTAIKKFKACGIPVVVISGDPWNEKIMNNRNIPFYCSKKSDGFLDKKQYISVLEKEYGIDRKEMAFVFDDFFDLDLAKEVGFVFCPKDSNTDVLNFCLQRYKEDFNFTTPHNFTIYNEDLMEDTPYVSNKNGGEACIDDLFYLCVNTFGLIIPNDFDNLVRTIDSKEK